MFDSLQSHCALNQFVRSLSATLLTFTIHNSILFSVISVAGECVREDAYGESILTLVGILIP